ncbi:biogenesis of lysosome-related organelles complex 1 subunit Kxd1p [Monosporozyma unispora]|nr:KxDL motif-containing protein 1 [Kazachstania unispora]
MDNSYDDTTGNYDTRHSQTPSISSQSYAIPLTPDMISGLSISPSSSSTDDDNTTSEDEMNISGTEEANNESHSDVEDDSLASEILESANEILQNNLNNDDDILRQTTTRNTTNYMDPQDQSPNNMIDISKYIFDSLKQAIEAADFSESLSYQTKTSAQINAKSLELKQLIDQTQSRLLYLQDRFERGEQVSRNIRNNLTHTKKSIERINNTLRTDYPIDFNQAREKIIERTLDDDDEVYH